MIKKTLYDVLESGRLASQYAIQCSYDRLSLKYNPDQPNNQNNEEARIKYYAIKEAFLVLGNSEKRSQYDQQLDMLANAVTQDFSGIDSFWTFRKVVVLTAIIVVAGSLYFYKQREKTVEEARAQADITNVTDGTFETEVLQTSGTPVLVDYWAAWCGPCRELAPTLDEVAVEYEGRVKVVKLNIDDSHHTPAKYGVNGLPTLMLFKNGNVQATTLGALSKSQLTAFIDGNIGSTTSE